MCIFKVILDFLQHLDLAFHPFKVSSGQEKLMMPPLCQSILCKHSGSKNLIWQSVDAANKNAHGLEGGPRDEYRGVKYECSLLQMRSNWLCGSHRKGLDFGPELHADACRQGRVLWA